VVAALWLLDGTSPARLSLLQPLTAWAAIALWWLSLRADPAAPWQRHLAPLAWAVTLTAMVLAWFDPLDGSAMVDPALIGVVRNGGAFLLPVTAFALGAHGSVRPGRRVLLLLVASAVALAWLWRWSPGITFAFALMLVAFARGSVVLLAVAVVALAIYLVSYYFQMTVPLLDKALWLGIAGAVLAAMHVVQKRWPQAQSP
jgi:hypothetical protein